MSTTNETKLTDINVDQREKLSGNVNRFCPSNERKNTNSHQDDMELTAIMPNTSNSTSNCFKLPNDNETTSETDTAFKLNLDLSKQNKNFLNVTGERLQFFKDGKFILELARATEGDKKGWISVPRKTFWPPVVQSSTTANFKIETLATRNDIDKKVSDESLLKNVSLVHSRQYHFVKQTQPQKRIMKALEFLFHRPKCDRISRKYSLHLTDIKRRRPFDLRMVESKADIRKPVKKVKRMNNLKIEIISRILTERLNKASNTSNLLKSAQFQNSLQTYISPRKRILKELEKVSLEDIATISKRSRAKKSTSANISPTKVELNLSPSTLPNNMSFQNKSSSNHSYNTLKSTSSSRISSYSINSLLNHDSRSKRESTSTSQDNLGLYNVSSRSASDTSTCSAVVENCELNKLHRSVQASSSFDLLNTTDKLQRHHHSSTGAKVGNAFQTTLPTSNIASSLREFSLKYSSDTVMNDYKHPNHKIANDIFSMNQPSESVLFPYGPGQNEKTSIAIKNESKLNQLENCNNSSKKMTFQTNSSTSISPNKLTMSMRNALSPDQLNYAKFGKEYDYINQEKLNFYEKHHNFSQMGLYERQHFFEKFNASKSQPLSLFSSLEYNNQNIAYYQQMYAAAAAQAAANYHHSVWFQYPVFDSTVEQIASPIIQDKIPSSIHFKTTTRDDDSNEDAPLNLSKH